MFWDRWFRRTAKAFTPDSATKAAARNAVAQADTEFKDTSAKREWAVRRTITATQTCESLARLAVELAVQEAKARAEEAARGR